MIVGAAGGTIYTSSLDRFSPVVQGCHLGGRMLYAIGVLGLLGDIIAIWLAIHSLKRERKNNEYLAAIMTEVHAAVTKES